MIEPPIRHPTGRAIDFIAKRLNLRNEPGMQDWEFEVSEPADLPRYLALYEEMLGDDDVRFVLADMIIQAFEDSDLEFSTNPDWNVFLSSLTDRLEVHGWQIWFWSSWDIQLEEAWRVSFAMRELCKIHFVTRS